MSLTMNAVLGALQPSGIRRITARAKQREGCVLLTLGEPDGDTAQAVKDEVAASLAAADTHYPPNNGYEYARAAVAEHMRAAGLDYASDEVILTCGATEALFAALTSVLNPGDEVIVPTPAFGLYESIVALNRGVFAALDTRGAGFQIREEALRARVTPRTRAIVITSPNNPTGCVYDAESLDAVARLARERDLFVVCDDVYASLVYDDAPGGEGAASGGASTEGLGVARGGAPVDALASGAGVAGIGGAPGPFVRFAARHPDLRDRIIVCDSFSKPYAMTGWRLGWVAADAPVIGNIAKVHQYMVSSVPSFLQRAAQTALAQDVAPARRVYRARRDFVVRRLREMGLPAVEPRGAFYAFPSIERFGMGSEEFCARAIDEAGVALVPGTCFSAEGYVRLSYCCDDDALARGLDRLDAFVGSLPREA